MKKVIIKYSLTVFIVGFSFWFYFQATTFPYKVARWFQPLEAYWVSSFVQQCSPSHTWLKPFNPYVVQQLGGYSAQIAFVSNTQQAHCEIGYKNKRLGEPVTAQSRYRYASSSKLVTAAAVHKLASEGRLQLNTKITEFFPELSEFADPRVADITLAHLLRHSAGFNRATLMGDPMFLRRKQPWCPYNPEHLQAIKLAFTPGEKQLYSNEGFCLLGEIIHRVTGQSYQQYVASEFALPGYGIAFIGDQFYADEVRYDYRYENHYNDSYLTLFDFNATASAAGLSGSALGLAQVLYAINQQQPTAFALQQPLSQCNLTKPEGCLGFGVRHYQPDEQGIMLHLHEGYLPGSASIAVIDSFGGVTVVVKSGKNRPQTNPNNEWTRWIYNRLTLYYTLQGKLPLLDKMFKH